MPFHIVITGAPASGKTLFFERLKNEPFTRGFYFFDELARKLLLADQSYRDNWKQFHIDIYTQQIERETKVFDKSFVTDRGTVDTFAFNPETVFDVKTTLADEYKRYDAVILLESSANLGENFYLTDEVRNESLSEAQEIENKLKKVWSEHPGYYFIQAQNSLENKYLEFIDCFKSIITEK